MVSLISSSNHAKLYGGQKKIMLKELGKIARVVSKFRGLDATMPLQAMDLFLQIALRPEGVALVDITKKLDLKSSAMSRNQFLLGDRTYRINNGPLKQGLGLTHTNEDPTDYRRNLLTLTKSGGWLVTQLVEIITERDGAK